ncbi:MAG: tyrosine-type recombinase/integrase [Blautia wexlerae]
MNTLETRIKNYIEYCTAQKRLDTKTLKAYKIDLRQFSEQISITEIEYITTSVLESYITNLHQQYSPKSVKRKIASIKAFFHYLEYKDIIILNPFNKLQIKFREPVILPKTIPLKTLEVLFNALHTQNIIKPQVHAKSEKHYVILPYLNYFLQQGSEFQSFVLFYYRTWICRTI